MKLKNIHIQNVRGMADWTLMESISKNRPHILVAPNGFGKTSIAKAFKSAADHTSLKIKDTDRHLHDPASKAQLSFEYEGSECTSNYRSTEVVGSNDIRKEFDILVISDLREVKAHAKNRGNYSTASGKLVIPAIEVCPVIRKPGNPYRITEAKAHFGAKSGLLRNLDNTVFNLDMFALRASELPGHLNRLKMARLWSRIESVRDIINLSEQDDKALDATVSGEVDTLKSENTDFAAALEYVQETTKLQGIDAFVTLWQLTELARRSYSAFQDYLNWLRYDALKESIKSGATDLSKAWKKISVNETKGKLMLSIPEPEFISNGQRDVLVLFALLHIARFRLQKNRAIIVVDEVFDYLDDANLTVVQYYLTLLIDEFKKNNKELYLLILTHLNPAFFQNYAFSDQKVIYLADRTAHSPLKAMTKLIGARANKEIDESLKKNISKYLVHYNAQDVNFSNELKTIKDCRSSWGQPGRFQQFLREEFDKFKKGEDGDPLAICAITRRSIEQLAFCQISDQEGCDEFFDVHKTAPKLKWAAKRGARIPEFHYLLRIIFDDGLHWSEGRSNLIPIIAKLNNPIIRELIIEVVETSMNSISTTEHKHDQ